MERLELARQPRGSTPPHRHPGNAGKPHRWDSDAPRRTRAKPPNSSAPAPRPKLSTQRPATSVSPSDAAPTAGPDDILAGAIGLLRDDRLTEAEAAFQAVLRTWPKHPDALHYLGVLRHAQGRHDEAIVLVREALAQQPDNAGAWNNLGNILLLSGAPDAAADAWQRSIDAGGAASAQALSNLAVLYRKQGRPADAERAARQAIAVNPDDGDGWYRLSQGLNVQGPVRARLLAHPRAVTRRGPPLLLGS